MNILYFSFNSHFKEDRRYLLRLDLIKVYRHIIMINILMKIAFEAP